MEDMLLEFIECCVHQILYHRKLYPASIFAKRLLYSIPVMSSQHSMVNDFISKHLETLYKALRQPDSDIKQLDMVLLDADEKILETFSFQIDTEKLEAMKDNNFGQVCKDVEGHLRSCLLKLSGRIFETSPDTNTVKTWTFHLQTSPRGAESLASDLKWCLSEAQSDNNDSAKRIMPIHSVTEPFGLRIFAEL